MTKIGDWDFKPAEIDWDELRKEQEVMKVRAEWTKRHGWKCPSVGTCRVCNTQDVVGTVRNGSSMVGGQPQWVSTGYYCRKCFVEYRRCPPPIRTMSKEEIEKFSG